jgi:FKBP-type peptidyl-prolyl cis-trans isomerase
MKISKTMFAAGAVTTITVASLAGLGVASAHGSNGRNVDDREQKIEQRHEQRAERLDALVQEGTLTETQKIALESKHEEMHALRDELKTQELTREEFREKMKESREAFKTWATEKGIDLETLRSGDGHRHAHGNRMLRNSQN